MEVLGDEAALCWPIVVQETVNQSKQFKFFYGF